MGRVVGHSSRGTEPILSVDSGSGGGDVEDILKRLGSVETHVLELRSQVSAILAVIPHPATKAHVVDVRTSVAELRADLSAAVGFARADLAVFRTTIRNWAVAAVLASAALAFTIAKFVH